MNDFLVLFAQNARFEHAQMMFKISMTVVGISIFLIGAGFIFAKPKDPEKVTTPATKWTGIAIVGAVGSAIIAYAWLGL